MHVTTVPETLGFFRGQISFMKESGFEVSAISSPGDEGSRFSQSEGIHFYPIQMTRNIDLLSDLRALAQLWIRFRRLQPSIVHAHTPKAGLLGVLSARLAGVPVVFLSVFGLPQMTMRGARKCLMNALTRLACLLAHGVWCDSFSMKEFLIKNRLCRRGKVFVIANGSVNGVDAASRFSPERLKADVAKNTRISLGIPAASVVIGFSGRIAHDKGMHELAEAWRLMTASRDYIHLVMIGDIDKKDPPRPEDIQLFTSDPKIHMVGFQGDVVPYLAAMDIFVMPSYREGFGLSNIEASAMGLPIVSTRIPGCIDSVKEGLTGLLVPRQDAKKLLNGILTYLNDPELRKVHGRAGRQRALSEFRPELIWQGLCEKYCALLAEKSRRGTKIRI